MCALVSAGGVDLVGAVMFLLNYLVVLEAALVIIGFVIVAILRLVNNLLLLLLDVYLAALGFLVVCSHVLLLLFLDHAGAIVWRAAHHVVGGGSTFVYLWQLLGHVGLASHATWERRSATDGACWRCAESLLLLLLVVYKLGVEEDQTLVHYLQGACHRLVVIVKLIKNISCSSLWQLNKKTLR